jgi:hypothetical protein
MNKILEPIIVKLVLSQAGPYIQKAVTAAVAAAIAWLAKTLPGAEAVITPEVLAPIIWLLLDSVVTRLAAGPLKKYAKPLQTKYNEERPKSLPPLKVDGYIGAVSAEAIAKQLPNPVVVTVPRPEPHP